jgi:hypothetical protein
MFRKCECQYLLLWYYDWYKQKDIADYVFTSRLSICWNTIRNHDDHFQQTQISFLACKIYSKYKAPKRAKTHRQKLSEAIHSDPVKINKSISISRHPTKASGQSHRLKAQTGTGIQTNFLQAWPKFCMVIGQFSPGVRTECFGDWHLIYQIHIWKWNQVSTHSWFISKNKDTKDICKMNNH